MRALERLVLAAMSAPAVSITSMPGGASTRRYLRVSTDRGSAVAMFVPDAAPEEVTSGGPTSRWPFLEVRDLLESRGIRVPRVLTEACEEGLILLEDLGDETLAVFLDRAPERREAIYRTAVTDLAIGQRALRELPASSVVASRGFDDALLRWNTCDAVRRSGYAATPCHTKKFTSSLSWCATCR